MIRIGFTGSRAGMSHRQKVIFKKLIWSFTSAELDLEKVEPNRGVEFHHGDAIGADAEAHQIARSFGCAIVIHPPLNPKYRAYCGDPLDRILEPDEYLIRNQAIVDQTDFLIATPRTSKEELRSGTWACLRYARDKTATPIIKLEP